MQEKTKKFIKYLKEKNASHFEIESCENDDILRRTETINGNTISTGIIIENTACSSVTYLLAHCPNEEKRKELLILLNELNTKRRLKFAITSDGAVYATFIYLADDNAFDSEGFIALYLIFMKSIIDDGDLNSIMKIIWG